MSEWRSLKEAVPFFDFEPLNHEIPILCFDGELVFAAFYDGKGFFIEHDDLGDKYFDDVSHWMFFPKPPEVKE